MKPSRTSGSIRIAIEQSLTWVPNLTGVARYGHVLYEGLREYVQARGLAVEVVGVPYPWVLKRLHSGAWRRVLYLVWLNIVFPFWVWKKRIDLVHHTNSLGPSLFKTARTVVTIHDMRYLKWGEISRKYRWYRHLLTLGTCRLADAIVTISQTASRDVRESLPGAARKVAMVYHGVDACFAPGDRPEPGEQRILLTVGPLTERKNHRIALRAFAELCRHSTRYTLVIAGEKAYYYEKLLAHAGELGLTEKVRFIGHVPDSFLPSLYRSAHLLLFPSVFEGFGYPIVEAMACGVPVIASAVPSSLEIGGDAATYARPDDAREWCAKILDFEDAAYYSRRVKLCLARAARFSRERELAETLRLYLGLLCRG